MIKEIRDYFADCYPHVDLSCVPDEIIQQFMDQDYINKLPSFEVAMDCLYDYILSQDLYEVEV